MNHESSRRVVSDLEGRRSAQRAPILVVHFLWHGFTFCSMPGTPNTWPDDHRWVSNGDERRVTCPTCQAEIARRRRS